MHVIHTSGMHSGIFDRGEGGSKLSLRKYCRNFFWGKLLLPATLSLPQTTEKRGFYSLEAAQLNDLFPQVFLVLAAGDINKTPGS